LTREDLEYGRSFTGWQAPQGDPEDSGSYPRGWMHGLRSLCRGDCIYKVPGEDHASLQTWCDIDLDRCIGCKHCAQVCPWDAIDMVDTIDVSYHVAVKGGPPTYVDEHWDNLVDAAQRNAEGLVAKKK
jgi:electron transport complex protein RnfB